MLLRLSMAEEVKELSQEERLKVVEQELALVLQVLHNHQQLFSSMFKEPKKKSIIQL